MGVSAPPPPPLAEGPGVIPRLAIETSGPVGSVALARGERVVARCFLEERTRHASALPGAMAAVLQTAGLRAREVGEVVVGVGPGSFTGVRVAGAAANGFAHALGIPVVPVSSLAGAALTASVLPAGVGPWPPKGREGDRPLRLRVLFDARGDRLFMGVYQLAPTALVVVEAPRFARLADVLAAEEGGPVCGDGAVRHRDAFEAAGIEVIPPPAGMPTAEGLLAARQRGVCGPVGPAGAWTPEYLRETGAVRARGGDGP